MNTEYLRYILAIDEHKSINKAAKELYITQPALSRILQGIEDNIGIEIFNRTNRGAETTEEGAEFIRRVKKMLSEVYMIQKDYFDKEEQPDDMVSLIVGAHWSSPALEACLRFYELIGREANYLNLIFQEESAETIMEGVNKGTLDLGIIHFVSNRENEIIEWCQTNDISCELIDESKLCAQIRSGHPLAKSKSIVINELKPYLYVTFSDEDLSGINYCSNISKFNWRVQSQRIVTNNRGALRSFILHSDGYYLGNNAKCELLNLEGTVSIPVEDFPYTIKTVSIHRNERVLSTEERRFLKCLTDIYHKA